MAKDFKVEQSVIDKLKQINPESGYFAFGLIYRTKQEWDDLLATLLGLGLTWGEATPGVFEESELGGNLLVYIAADTGKCMIKSNLTTGFIDKPDHYNHTSSVSELLTLLSGDFSVIVLSQSRLLLNQNGAYYCIADSPGIMINRKFGWDTFARSWDARVRVGCKNDPETLKKTIEKFPGFTFTNKGQRVLVVDLETKEIITTEDPPAVIVYNPIEEYTEFLECDVPLVAKLHGLDAIFIGKKGYIFYHAKEAGSPIELPDFYEIGQYLEEYKKQYIDPT